ncbi:MAG: glutamine synthetase [Candidatus Bathyarchaeota archaeon]|nr:MAG: glutamine synthetase [Candidatus Bathyarchaeota archaeon]
MEDLSTDEFVRNLHKTNTKIVNLCHIPEDGSLRSLSFTVRSIEKLRDVLEFGERVDGSSLFSFLEPSKSDIYIAPRLESSFTDPFSSISTTNIMCEYLAEDGMPLDVAPQAILSKAEDRLYSRTQIVLMALAEIEFYIASQRPPLYPTRINNNYHQSSPFTAFGDVRNEILVTLDGIGIPTKYAHAEVGQFHSKQGFLMEQHEVEILPQNLGRMAEAIAISKWVVRNVCAKHNLSVTFSPKPSLLHPGNGMHLHLCGLRNSRNVVANSKKSLTTDAKLMIGGILTMASSLTALGNTIPPSYLRLASRQESPLHICWGNRDRAALIRIPLWWNPMQDLAKDDHCTATFEYRAPDLSTNSHLLLAGITVAVKYGLENSEKAIDIADSLNCDTVNDEDYKVLPLSCVEAAECLQSDRGLYEAEGVFPKSVVDSMIKKLRSYKDEDLQLRLRQNADEAEDLLIRYWHYG